MPPKTYADIPPAAVCDYLLSQGWAELEPLHSASREYAPPDPRQFGFAIPVDAAPADDPRPDRWAMTIKLLARALNLGPNGLAMTVMNDHALWQLPRIVSPSAQVLAAHPGFVWDWGMLPVWRTPSGGWVAGDRIEDGLALCDLQPGSVPDLDDAMTVSVLLGQFRAMTGEPFVWVEPRVYCGHDRKILTGWQVATPRYMHPLNGNVGLSEGDAVALALLEQLDKHTASVLDDNDVLADDAEIPW